MSFYYNIESLAEELDIEFYRFWMKGFIQGLEYHLKKEFKNFELHMSFEEHNSNTDLYCRVDNLKDDYPKKT